MSYLELKEGIPDFSKAVISLWFRAPKESVIKAATGKVPGSLENFDLMQGILPLVTFGKQHFNKNWQPVYPPVNVGTIVPYLPGEPGAGTTFMAFTYAEGPQFEVDPCYIGLLCNSDGTFRVVFHLQMENPMDFTASSFQTISGVIYSGSDPGAPVEAADTPGSGVVTDFPNVVVVEIAEISYIDQEQGEYFEVQSDKFYDPDVWHHVVVSFDVSGEVSIGTPFASSSCKLWYAIDDVDYRGRENMQPYRETGGQWGPDTLGDNTIITRNAWAYSGSDPDFEAIHYYQNHYVGLIGGTWTAAPIPTSDAPLGIPAAARYVEGIYKVEMAEFLLFTDVTLDTGVEGNRRLFISKPDKDGFQHPTNFSPITIPMHKFAWGDPAIWEPGADWPAFAPGLDDPSAAPTALRITGSPPAVIAAVDFTKCAFNWMMGRNAGTSKGKVERVGNVKSYWPPEFESPRIKSDT